MFVGLFCMWKIFLTFIVIVTKVTTLVYIFLNPVNILTIPYTFYDKKIFLRFIPLTLGPWLVPF